MKYTSKNKPLVCMQTQSTCYKGTKKMTVKGILWHSSGANNPNLKRYVQPSDSKPSVDTYTKAKWLEVLGKNAYSNDWNHINREAGLNCWIGKLADGTVTAIQTMPWDFRPWGCASGSKGSCNDGWIQFEICEDGLTDKTYFNKAYKEACEITAYLCKLYNIDPKGTVTHKGVKVPTILCHQDAYKLGLGSNHGDVYSWFKKHNKTMDDVRKDVAAIIKADSTTYVKTYKVLTSINKYSTSADAKVQKNAKGKLTAGTYYLYNKYPEGYNGVYNVTTDKTGTKAGSWINPKENVLKEEAKVEKLYRVRKSKDDASSQKGAYEDLTNAKAACDKAGEGYHVFDWNWNIVYTFKKETTKTVKQEVAKEPIVENLHEDIKEVITEESVIKPESNETISSETSVEQQPEEQPDIETEPETPTDVADSCIDIFETPTDVPEQDIHEETSNNNLINAILNCLSKVVNFIINLFNKGE